MDRLGTEITSSQNPKIKEVARLRQERHRKKRKKILVDGIRETMRAVRAGIQLESLFVEQGWRESELFSELCSTVQPNTLFHLPKAIFEKIAYGERNEGVVAVFEEKKIPLEKLALGATPMILILDGIEKPGNVGAVFRTASAAGVDSIILTHEVCSPFNANAVRSSLGTVFELPFATAEFSTVTDFLKERKIDIVTTRVDAQKDYIDFDFSQPVAIVLGSEAHGVSSQWFPFRSVTIPMQRAVDSLNISATAAVVAFEVRRQRSLS